MTTQVPKSKEDLEKEKLAVEILKITEEYRDQKRYWLTKPQYIAALLPFLAALITAVIFWLNGAFSAKRQELEANKAILRLEILEFEKARDSVKRQFEYLQNKVSALERRDSISQAEKGEMRAMLNELFGSDSTTDIGKAIIKSDADGLKVIVYQLMNEVADYQHKMDLANIRYEELRDSIKSKSKIQ